jgi:hypothetical protein
MTMIRVALASTRAHAATEGFRAGNKVGGDSLVYWILKPAVKGASVYFREIPALLTV